MARKGGFMSINPAHLHLVLNHFPVLGVLFGTLLLAVGLWRRNDTIRRTSLVVLLLTGVAAGAVYLTGEPAEELIQDTAGVSESRIERHEDAAAVATTGAALLGVAALVLLWRSRRTGSMPSTLLLATFGLAVLTTVLMAWTANLGGKIRHSEITTGVTSTETATPGNGDE
jgi:uncharacterized membrane protein